MVRRHLTPPGLPIAVAVGIERNAGKGVKEMEREGEKGGDSSWVHDVCIQNDVDRAAAGTGHIIATTGGHVWDAAKRMAAFLEASEAELGLR